MVAIWGEGDHLQFCHCSENDENGDSNDDRVDIGDREAVPVMPWRRHDAEPLSTAGSMLPASTESYKVQSAYCSIL